MQDQKIRLQKMLADCGVASRRKAEELIQQGKVKVNGHVAQIGDKVNPKTDHVTVAGRRIVASRQYYYIMLHKPRGYVSTMSDEMGRKCVAELVKDIPARVSRGQAGPGFGGPAADDQRRGVRQPDHASQQART